jgi:Bacterial mobilisation protein (MobC)
MGSDHFVAARVSSETKSRLRALAERRQLSESALLKSLLEMMLQSAGSLENRVLEPCQRSHRGARLYVRLRPDDRLLLHERAAARGMAGATFVSILVRAHLRNLAPLPKDELLALKRSVAELGAIGRNLNQIARTANRGELVTGPGREDLKAMLRVCEGLRNHVKGLLSANVRSWEQGDADLGA